MSVGYNFDIIVTGCDTQENRDKVVDRFYKISKGKAKRQRFKSGAVVLFLNLTGDFSGKGMFYSDSAEGFTAKRKVPYEKFIKTIICGGE